MQIFKIYGYSFRAILYSLCRNGVQSRIEGKMVRKRLKSDERFLYG
jgi:hypothetical protein